MKEKILDKIKKLLALSSNNSNESEAMAAMAKVQELLTENGLNLEDLPPDELTENEVGEDNPLAKGSANWKKLVMMGVGLVNDCYVYTSRSRGQIIVGRKVRIEIALSMADYLYKLIDRECQKNKAYHLTEWDNSRKWSTDFKMAMADRIYVRLKQQKDEANESERHTKGSSTSLILANENQAYLASKGIRLGRRTINHSSRTSGTDAGREAGDRAGLHNQVGGASTPRNRMLSGY